MAPPPCTTSQYSPAGDNPPPKQRYHLLTTTPAATGPGDGVDDDGPGDDSTMATTGTTPPASAAQVHGRQDPGRSLTGTLQGRKSTVRAPYGTGSGGDARAGRRRWRRLTVCAAGTHGMLAKLGICNLRLSARCCSTLGWPWGYDGGQPWSYSGKWWWRCCGTYGGGDDWWHGDGDGYGQRAGRDDDDDVGATWHGGDGADAPEDADLVWESCRRNLLERGDARRRRLDEAAT